LVFEARGFSGDLPITSVEVAGFYERAVQLDPNFALAWARLSRVDASIHFDGGDAARGDAAKRALDNAQKLAPDSPETLLALGWYQFFVLREYGLAETTFGRVSKMLPGSSEAAMALGRVTRRAGKWDQSIAHSEQALALDPRNVESLVHAAETYIMLRQFPAALRLYDRALDIMPNDPDVMAAKAMIYQAQGNLQEATKLLTQITAQARNGDSFLIKITQLRLERNYAEAVRLLRARLARGYSTDPFDKAHDQVALALTQRLARDMAGAKATAELARNTFAQLSSDQPDNALFPASLSEAYAVMGEKESALNAAERAIMLRPSAKDAVAGPDFEENLALIQTIFGENSRAISALNKLLQTPYSPWICDVLPPITPALLRLDPLWDPLRADPAFQKLCQEKHE
jgi:tetratricopeptide (TPR) repeat protein